MSWTGLGFIPAFILWVIVFTIFRWLISKLKGKRKS